MKKLHNKDFSIAVKKGTDANKSKFATEAVQGEMYFATDSGSLYIANTTAGASNSRLTRYDFNNPFQLTSDTEANILATTPVNPSGESTIMYSTDTDDMYIYNGGNWYTFNNGFSVPNTYSMSFDGSNDFMTVPDDASLNVSSGFTVSAWIYLNSLNSFQGIASKRDDSGTTFQFYIRDTNILSYYNGSNVYNDTTALSSGVWTHVAITATSNSSASFYIDGSLSSTISIGVIGSSTSDLYIGQITGMSHLNGKLDELAVFNTALSASDVSSIYNSGTPADIYSLNPVGWWRMGDNDGGTGTTITDQGSGGNDATLVNGPTFSTDTPS